MGWQTFLSYSRNDYQAAEFMVLALQQRGISVWFDVQQLEPGTDWQQDIHNGLEQSEGVLLLASRSALDSPYVEREWRHAIEAGKPVIIARLDRVWLPPDLRGKPVIDCRQNTSTSIEQVFQAIQNPGAAVQRHAWFFRSLPSIVRRTAIGLLLTDAANIARPLLFALIWQALFQHSNGVRWLIESAAEFLRRQFRFTLPVPDIEAFAHDGGIVLALILIIAALPVLRLFLLLRHWIRVVDHIPRRMGFRVLIVLNLVLLSGLIPAVSEQQSQSGFAPVDLLQPVVFFGIIGIIWFVGKTGQRLLPAGGSAALREWARFGTLSWTAAHGTTLPPTFHKTLPEKMLRFQLVSTAYDAPAIEAIRPILTSIGGVLVDGSAPADYVLVFLNLAASRGQIASALNSSRPVIGIITSPFHLPESLQAIKKLQLVDFSSGDRERLMASLRLLTTSSDQLRSELQTWLGPVNLRRISLPAPLQNGLTRLLSLIMLSVCVLVILLVAGFNFLDSAVLLAESGLALLLLPLLLLQRGHVLPPLLLVALPVVALGCSGAALGNIPVGTLLGGLLAWETRFMGILLATGSLIVMMMFWELLRKPIPRHKATDALGMPPASLPFRNALIRTTGLLVLILLLTLGDSS